MSRGWSDGHKWMLSCVHSQVAFRMVNVGIGRIHRGEAGRQSLLCAFVVQTAEGKLPEVVDALTSPSGLARGLNCRQEQCHEDANNGDDHKQLDERKRREVPFAAAKR